MLAIFTNTTPELIAIMIFENTWYLIDVLLKNQPLKKTAEKPRVMCPFLKHLLVHRSRHTRKTIQRP